MKFSRLRLLGFKSFVEPSDFVIERGLTGVVGPNGCGKSNLVEALRWVMGESSYKNMRASGMDDVIFSGSSTRPARNTAEVTLFLENADRTAPAAFNDVDELQVSRRIEREAGSIYRINGKEARAKDVQLLFADQSTGARSPSMVGQGRIGELIQAKPQARRALLEEAAGISGLHSRRHEAELQAARRRAEPRTARRRGRRTGKPDREPEAAGPPGGALQEPVGRHPQGRGDAAASQVDSRQGPGSGGAVGVEPGDLAGRRARPGADGSRQAAGDRRPQAAGTARRRGQGRRRAAAPDDRARPDRGRGGAGAHPQGGAREAAGAARGRRRARKADHGRQCRRAGAAGRGGARAQHRECRGRRQGGADACRPRGGRGETRRQRAGACRPHLRARRGRGPASSGRACAARGRGAAPAAGTAACRHRTRGRRDRRPHFRAGRPRREACAGRTGRRSRFAGRGGRAGC